MLLKGFLEILRDTNLLPCKSDWHPLKIETTLTSLAAETTGRKTETETGTETGEGIGIGIGTEAGAGTALEMGIVTEGQDIVVGMQDDHLNVYSVLYTLIRLVLPNLLYC